MTTKTKAETKKREPWAQSARMVVALLTLALGMTLTTSSFALIRGNAALDKVKTQSACNSDWKKAYRAAQKPRLKAQKARDESLLKFFRDLDRLVSDTSPSVTPAEIAAKRAAAHKAIKAAYDDTADQLDAQDQNTYPTDECGRKNSRKATTDRPPLSSPKENSDGGKASVDSGSGSGDGGAHSHGSVGVGSGPAAGGHGGSGGGGGSAGNPGGGTPGSGGDGTPSPSSLIGDLLAPVCRVVLLPGCGS